MTTYEIVNIYLAEQRISLAKNTIRLYQSILTDLALDMQEPNKAKLLKHLGKLKEEGNTNNTIRTKLTIIKSFVHWAYINDYYPTDFAESVKLPTAEHKVVDRMSKEEVQKMMAETPKGTHNPFRNKALMELAIVTASRVSALCEIKRSDVDLERKIIRLKHTKRNKELELPLTDSVCKAIEDYIVFERPDALTDNDYLFVGQNAKDGAYLPLSRQQIYNISKRYTLNACGRALSPHKLRHTSASLQLESGKLSIDEISENLGHSSVATTQRYAHRLNDKARKTATAEVFSDIF